MTHIQTALNYVCTRRGTTVTALAAAAGLYQSTLSRAMSGTRLDPDSLRKLCTRSQPADGLEILMGHLRDEIDRAGRLQTEIRIQADTADTPDDLRLLASECKHDETLRHLLHDIADLIRRRPISTLAAAETPPDYGKNPESRK